MMNLEDCINYINPYIKVMGKKSGKILLIDTLLFYIDNEESQLSFVELNQSTGQTICCTKEIFNAYLKKEIPYFMNDYLIYYNILNRYNMYNGLDQPMIEIINLQENERIAELIKLKSKEGLIMYNLEDKILLPFFYGVLPMTKSDSVDLRIFELDEISVASKYTVRKKSLKANIDIYMRLMKF